MSPQSSKGILPLSGRGLNLQPHVRSLSSKELGSQRGSMSVKPSMVVNNEELDMSWIQSSHSSDPSSSNSVDSRSEWGSSSGKLDWAINKEESTFSFFGSPLEETPHE
nr:hypothetical protein [Tanacetum cinerariifolium]